MGKIGIIIQREFNERVRKKSFIITTILTPLLFIGIMVVAMYMGMMKSSGTKEIVVADASGLIAPQLENAGNYVFEMTDKTPEQVRSEKVAGQHPDLFGILVIGADIMDNPRNVQLYSYSPSTAEVERELSGYISGIIETEKLKGYDIENLSQIMQEVKTRVSLQAFRVDESGNEKQSSSGLSQILAYIFGFLIYMFVFLYGAMVMQGVIEEKSSKVLEIMVSSVKPFQLMMGKILGIALVAITQFLIWVFVIIVGMVIFSSFLAADAAEAAKAMSEGGMGAMGGGMQVDMGMLSTINNILTPSFMATVLGGFLVYFVGGYLLYAAMFAAVGSAVDNAADAQQLQLPITIPMFLALIVMMNVMKDPNSSMAFWFSIIPFTSPIIMIARLPYGVPMWEIALSVTLLYGSFIFMVWFAGKIYRVGIFMYGKKPTLKELIKWSKYKY